MDFEIVSGPANIEIIAVASAIRELPRLKKVYGKGRWRKLKGDAVIRLADGTIANAEVHWFEAHGIGKKEFKIKCFLD